MTHLVASYSMSVFNYVSVSKLELYYLDESYLAEMLTPEDAFTCTQSFACSSLVTSSLVVYIACFVNSLSCSL